MTINFKDDMDYSDFLTIRFFRNLQSKKCVTWIHLLYIYIYMMTSQPKVDEDAPELYTLLDRWCKSSLFQLTSTKT